MLIFVKTLTGKTLNINIDPSDSVATVKTQIEEQTGCPPFYQKLIFAGKVLED
jgi:ubiquitin C